MSMKRLRGRFRMIGRVGEEEVLLVVAKRRVCV